LTTTLEGACASARVRCSGVWVPAVLRGLKVPMAGSGSLADL
jgi:hypothetical protein